MNKSMRGGAVFLASQIVGQIAGGVRTVSAANFDPPPIAARARTEHHGGKVIWAELVTPDLELAEHFDAGLFDCGLLGAIFHDPIFA